MKHPLIFLLFFTALTSMYAQDTLNRKDAGGKKIGFWIKKDKDGNKIYEGRFEQDVPYGEFRYYYPEGQLKAVNIMSDSGRRTSARTFYRNGRKMADGMYIDEKREGLWKFYSQYEDVVVSEEFYRKGKKEGIARTFYVDGVIAETMTWKDGVRCGPWEQFYTDGKLKLKCAFSSDMKEGPVKTFHISSKPWLSGQYVNGEPDGTWTYLDEKGAVEMKEYYKMGRLVRTDDFREKEKSK